MNKYVKYTLHIIFTMMFNEAVKYVPINFFEGNNCIIQNNVISVNAFASEMPTTKGFFNKVWDGTDDRYINSFKESITIEDIQYYCEIQNTLAHIQATSVSDNNKLLVCKTVLDMFEDCNAVRTFNMIAGGLLDDWDFN